MNIPAGGHRKWDNGHLFSYLSFYQEVFVSPLFTSRGAGVYKNQFLLTEG